MDGALSVPVQTSSFSQPPQIPALGLPPTFQILNCRKPSLINSDLFTLQPLWSIYTKITNTMAKDASLDKRKITLDVGEFVRTRDAVSARSRRDATRRAYRTEAKHFY